MLRPVHLFGIIALLLAAFLCRPELATAQIAPTTGATISGSVSDSAGNPVANAKVSLKGPKVASMQTDAHGLFVFVGLPFGTYTIIAAAATLGTATREGVVVQGDTNVAIQYAPASVSGFKVIANVSSSADAHFNITPASITQVDPTANAFEGKTSWRTILEQIPGVAQAGLGNAGLNPFAALPDGPMVPMQISINGALPYETAILIDDMPLMMGYPLCSIGDGGTNLGLYPLNSFGAADVIRGPGASAPSIVDSIGGSFVLHSPGAVSANHSTFSLSTDPYGGIVANALTAVRWHKLSAVVTYGVNDSPGPTNSGLIPAITSIYPVTVNGSPFVCPASCANSELLSPHYASASAPFYGFNVGLQVCCYQESTAWSQHSGSVALHYAFSPAVSADVFYTGQTSVQAKAFPYQTINFAPPTGYTGSNPAGERTFLEDGYLLSPFQIQQAASLLEEKITARIGNGFLQLAALQNRTFGTQYVSSPASATLQLFGGGCMAASTTSGGCPTGYSPAVFNGGMYDVTYTPENEGLDQTSNNRDLSLEYTSNLGESLHAGVSFVQSYYNVPTLLTVQLGNPPLFSLAENTPSADSQVTNEFRVFVGGTPSAKTSLDLSMYFTNVDYHIQNPSDSSGYTYVDERYSYAAPRLGFVWRPTASVAVRAAAGGGFAEAPLQYLAGFLSNANGVPNCLSGVSCAVTLTNVNLQPEKSFGFDLGTDIRLRRNTVLSFDLYRTNLYGQFYNSTSLTGTYLGLPLYTTQYGNLAQSRYEGLLVDLRHDAPRGIYWRLSGGLTRGYVISVPTGFYSDASGPCNHATATTPDGNPCPNITVVPNINFDAQFTTVSIPYSQALGTFGYRWNAEKYVDLAGTYYGNNNTYFRPAFVELDGHLAYPLSKSTSLLLTFRNITGIYDGATQLYAPANLIGAPTVAGLPYPLYGEEYGPRTLIVTTRVSF